MTDTEGEIEFLDEDAEIVYQCMQNSQANRLTEPSNSLLVEQKKGKRSSYKRRRSTTEEEDDSDTDYNPRSDMYQKRKLIGVPKVETRVGKSYLIPQVKTYIQKKKQHQPDKIHERRKMCVQIPDYEDPLCMPVKMFKKDGNDDKRLKSWNKLCLEHLKHSDNLKPRYSNAVSSRRTVVLRNFRNNSLNKPETAVWSKTVVSNTDGEETSEVFSSVLPKFREKKLLDYKFTDKLKKPTSTTSTVVLTKEVHKGEESLVVYNVDEALSSIYKMQTETVNEGEARRVCGEAAAWRSCAPCHQAAWRPPGLVGTRNTRDITCAICSRKFISVYNFLAHVKVHSAKEVRLFSSELSEAISKFVTYHYKCRICAEKSPNIKSLRQHVKTHRSKEPFHCEIGNHIIATE